MPFPPPGGGRSRSRLHRVYCQPPSRLTESTLRIWRPVSLCDGSFPRRGDLPEGGAATLKDRVLARECFPALHSDIDIGRIQFDGVDVPASHLASDDGCTGAAEWLVHSLAGVAVILDRPLHAFHW